MDDISQIIKTTQFTVTEASYATVGSFWKDMVAFEKHNRIYYIMEGSAELELLGKKVHLQAGKLYFIPAYSVIAATCKEFLSHYYIHFIADKGLSNLFESLNFDQVVAASSGDENLFKTILSSLPTQPPTISSALNIDGALRLLLSRFFLEAHFINYDILRFSDIIAYIEDNITKKITIKELALVKNLNTLYFSQAFKKAFGVTPSQFIISKKINYSMTLLLLGQNLVRDVAYQLGFEDEFYFSRLFKKKVGMSPKQFMNKVSKWLIIKPPLFTSH